MMRSFFLEVPGEELEAASIDGASLLRTMRTVLLPMVASGIAAKALICVIFAWNPRRTPPVRIPGNFCAAEDRC